MIFITGDSSQHGKPPPVLVEENGSRFVFVHPRLAGHWNGPIRFATKEQARAKAAQIPGPREIVELDGGRMSVEKHPGKP